MECLRHTRTEIFFNLPGAASWFFFSNDCSEDVEAQLTKTLSHLSVGTLWSTLANRALLFSSSRESNVFINRTETFSQGKLSVMI